MSYLAALSHVIDTVIAPVAEQTARTSRFPRRCLDALAQAGFLGLTADQHLGGGGHGPHEAAEVVAQVSRVCPATAAVLQSHYAAIALLGPGGDSWLGAEIAAGRHLCTVALADDPALPAMAAQQGGVVRLTARKRAVVAAGEADSYVWSSPDPLTGAGTTLWVVPAQAPGLFVPALPDSSGPAGSATSNVTADPVRVPATALLHTTPSLAACRAEGLLPAA